LYTDIERDNFAAEREVVKQIDIRRTDEPMDRTVLRSFGSSVLPYKL